VISLPDWGLAPSAFLRKRKVCVGVYRIAAREHLLGVEFPSAGLDAGGSEQNHSNQKRCKNSGLSPAWKGGLFHLSASVVNRTSPRCGVTV